MKLFFDEIFAVTPPGLEELCAAEIRGLFGCQVTVSKGGVTFSGGLRELYMSNLWLRCTSRVLVRVGTFKSRDFPDLHRKVKKLPWGRFIRPDIPVTVRATSRRSRLIHSDRLETTVADAINGALGRSCNPGGECSQLVVARFEDDSCQLSVDSSGELLYRRGYRTELSKAPLRETLAAGILGLLGWDGARPLYDPMCGSGTFPIEAALIATGRPPGENRSFAFEHWPRFRSGLWNNLLLEAGRKQQGAAGRICGSDRDAVVIEGARRNAERAGCAEVVSFSATDLADVELTGNDEQGLVVCNPPYGVRIGEQDELVPLYKQIGSLYRERFAGWQGALFCPSDELAEATGLKGRVVARLVNGGLPTTLYSFEM